MTKEQRSYIDAIYQNCCDHLENTVDFWSKAWSAFQKVADACGDDPETNQHIVTKLKLLEKEAHVFG